MTESQAQSLLVQQKSIANSIDILNKSKPNQQVLILRSLETLEKVAQGQATKIIIPFQLQSLSSIFTTLDEVFASNSKDANLEDDIETS